jgi:hypothetical protein
MVLAPRFRMARLLGASPPMRMTASWLRCSRVGRIQVRGARSARRMASSSRCRPSCQLESARSRKSAAVLAAVNGKSLRDGLQPPLTAAARSGPAKNRSGRGDVAARPNKEMAHNESLDTNCPIQVLWPDADQPDEQLRGPVCEAERTYEIPCSSTCRLLGADRKWLTCGQTSRMTRSGIIPREAAPCVGTSCLVLPTKCGAT